MVKLSGPDEALTEGFGPGLESNASLGKRGGAREIADERLNVKGEQMNTS